MTTITASNIKKKSKPTETQIPGFDIFYNHKRQLFAIIGALMVAMLLSALDQMIFSTALPTIVGELHGVSQMLWVTTAYILAATISMPLYGKISDLIGRKALLLIGIGIFVVGSIIGGLAQDMTWLIVARAIQGFGGGGLMILSQAVIADVVPLQKRGKYMGLIGAVFGLSSVVGPLLGGFFTDGPGWRWAFWFNLPIGVIAFAVVFLVLKIPFKAVKVRFDILGTATMAVAVASLVLFTSWGGTTYAWNSATIISLIVTFAVFTVLFILAEMKASEPIIPLKLFKDANFSIAAFGGLLVGIGMFGALAYLPTYLQIVHGLGATNSGLLILPMMGGLIGTSILSGQIISRTGQYKWFPVIGFAMIGFALYLFSTMVPSTPLWQSSLYMVLMGGGIGMVMQILVLIIQNSAPQSMVGVATATNNFFREIGASLGGAIVGSLFSHNLTTTLAKNLPPSMTKGHSVNSLTPAVIDALPKAIKTIVIDAYNTSLTPVFSLLIPLFVVGLVALIFVKQTAIRGGVKSEHMADEAIEALESANPIKLDFQTDRIPTGVNLAKQGAQENVSETILKQAMTGAKHIADFAHLKEKLPEGSSS
jgi:EmrB/QacA subfamily drug resistance transporter